MLSLGGLAGLPACCGLAGRLWVARSGPFLGGTACTQTSEQWCMARLQDDIAAKGTHLGWQALFQRPGSMRTQQHSGQWPAADSKISEQACAPAHRVDTVTHKAE